MSTSGLAEQVNVASAGHVVDTIEVSIGPRFLDLFSSQLYSSPNKAFEELVSNSWDAEAQNVYIGVPKDLSDTSALVWVLDDGESMNLAGLHELWHVAESTKRTRPSGGRPQIGKFGIGKLATYLLANQLTYVCKAANNPIRAVTMDYRKIDSSTPAAGGNTATAGKSASGATSEDRLHRSDAVELDVRELDDAGLRALLGVFANGDEIRNLIEEGVPKPKAPVAYEDEFGGKDSPSPQKRDTWTLVLLTSLKPAGKEMESGQIRWLLRTALPLGSSISIVYNNETLPPSKIDAKVADEWVLGTSLGISSITLANDEEKQVTECSTPYPHVRIEGIEGPITGRVRRYETRISGGKSDALESSNGFLVNIKGRVVNPVDPYFGLKNLNHSAWAHFRATIRIDGLDDRIGVNREGLRAGSDLTIFQAFLRALFNKARNAHDAASQAAWPKAGEVLTQSWGAVPFDPLNQAVLNGLESGAELPGFVDASDVVDMDATRREWERDAKDNPGRLIKDVVLEPLGNSDNLVKYDLAQRRVVVNRNHPFSREYGQTREQQFLLRDAAFVDMLTEAYMLSIGIDEGQLSEIREYRDQAYRLIAQVRRRTGKQIAEMLVNATDNKGALETIVGDALEYLGFDVERMAQPGFPEGVATAPATPSAPMKPGEEDERVSYRFTYDAKSSQSGKVKTGNIGTAGLVRHREDHKADHILVVAPDYEVTITNPTKLPDLIQECRRQSITPMRAEALAKLLMLAATTGPLNLIEFREVLNLNDPNEVDTWVSKWSAEVEARPRLSLDLFLTALVEIGYAGPDAIHASVIADRIKNMDGVKAPPRRSEIVNIAAGLAVLVPNLVRVNSGSSNIYLSTSPQKLRDAIVAQIQEIPSKYRFGIDKAFS